MLQMIYEWMRNIIVFMILTTVVLNLVGKGNYKKYVKLITGLILVLLVIQPVLSLTGNAEFMNFSLESYESLDLAKDLDSKIFSMDQARDIDIMKEYKEVIYRQTQKLVSEQGLEVVSMSMKVDEDRASMDFGRILQLSLSARYQGMDSKQKEETFIREIKNVEKIQIDPVRLTEPEEIVQEEQKKSLSAMEIHIKKLLSDFYNIPDDNINITIQEDRNGTRK